MAEINKKQEEIEENTETLENNEKAPVEKSEDIETLDIETSSLEEIEKQEEIVEEPIEETIAKEQITEEAEDNDFQITNEKETTIETGQNEDLLNSSNGMVNVRPVKFHEFPKHLINRSVKKNLDIMQDVSMHITVELGRTKSSIKEVMEFEKGSVVELNKIAGEQVEVYVNGKLSAKGEVIVIEDKFGVRITTTNFAKENF